MVSREVNAVGRVTTVAIADEDNVEELSGLTFGGFGENLDDWF